MNLKLLSNHKLVGTREVIGRNLENKANYFIIAIPNELLDYSISLEFQKSKEKYSSSAIKIIDGIITYPIYNSLLDENKVTIQVVARKDDITWKSQMVSFDVDDSINASEVYEEEYPDFIGEVEEQVANKQDKLISGVNIKTINGESLLGEGNIEIQGGSGGDAYTKEETDELLETKLDKNIDVTPLPFAYIKNADGSQAMLELDRSASGNTLVQRESNGRVKVANPVDTTDAVNKGYLGVIDTDIAPKSSTSYLSLGSSSKTFATAYVTTLRVTNLYPLGSSTSAIIFSSKDTKLYTNLLTQKILPSDNLAYDIGDSSNQYGNIYGKIIYQDNKQVATKEETNNLLDEKANKTDVYTKEETDAKLDAKADKNDIPTKTSQLENDSEYVTNARLTAGLSTKADREKVYTKTEVDDKVDAKQDILISGTNIKTINGQSILGEGNIDVGSDDTYTKEETNALLDTKADKSTTLAGYGITNAYTKTETDNQIYNALTTKIVVELDGEY